MLKFSIISFFLGAFVGAFITYHIESDKIEVNTKQSKYVLTKAIPPNFQTIGNNLECKNKSEYDVNIDTSIKILENNLLSKYSALKTGAKKYLSSVSPLCASPEKYTRLTNILTRTKGLDYLLVEHDLDLISKLPNPTTYVYEKLSNIAFDNQPYAHITYYWEKPKDLRPLARSILASFNYSESRISQLAYGQISRSDSLGTGAAQVAAASNYKDSLTIIEKLMEEILMEIPQDRPIPAKEFERLYELAIAVYFSGENGKNYTSQIKNTMNRKIEKFIPHFGGPWSVDPKQMCGLLLEIYEGDKTVINNYQYCRH